MRLVFLEQFRLKRGTREVDLNYAPLSEMLNYISTIGYIANRYANANETS